MILLVLGFGAQIGMFFYAREQMHESAAAGAAASTGISAASMVACCAHHLADILPFLGISALGILFAKYQTVFLLAGILSNILGISYMLMLIGTDTRKEKLRFLFYSLLAVSIMVLFAYYFFISNSSNVNMTNIRNKIVLEILTNKENNVEFKVAPISTSQFRITINTHSVELDFDLTEISVLYDDAGNSYKPITWEGSGQGGHHREGILGFPTLNENTKSIKLVITDNTRREFNWRLE
jgi:hypothetical protein